MIRFWCNDYLYISGETKIYSGYVCENPAIYIIYSRVFRHLSIPHLIIQPAEHRWRSFYSFYPTGCLVYLFKISTSNVYLYCVVKYVIFYIIDITYDAPVVSSIISDNCCVFFFSLFLSYQWLCIRKKNCAYLLMQRYCEL